MADAPRWSDDPWSALTTGEGEAYRRGWEAGLRKAAEACKQRALVTGEGDTVRVAAIRMHEALACETIIYAIAAMEPPA